MKKKEIKTKSGWIRISTEVLQKARDCVKDLNAFSEKFGVPADNHREKFERGEEQKVVKFKRKPIPELTIKHFTEAALLHFVKNRFDPRFYDDSKDVIASVNKLRNHLFSFMQVQERKKIRPLLEKMEAQIDYQTYNDKRIYAAIKVLNQYLIKAYEDNSADVIATTKKLLEGEAKSMETFQENKLIHRNAQEPPLKK